MSKPSIKFQSAQGGFTLIELIVVIVILGILAATALPKFLDVGTDARKAKINAMAGAMKAAAATAHGAYLLNSASVKLEGVTISMSNGYPDATATGIVAALTGLEDYDTATADGLGVQNSTYVVATDSGHVGCKVTYTPATSTAAAKVVTDPTGC